MLFVQDSFSHGSSLLMSPPKTTRARSQNSAVSTVLTGTASCRKSLDQLINDYEFLQSEIVNTQLQIESTRHISAKNEKEALRYTTMNKSYRARIKEIMQQIESKQKILEGTKATSSELELKVKQLKDEALASRGQLEDLRRQEQLLQQEKDVVAKEKKQVELQLHILKESICQLQMRCDRETALLRRDHLCVVEQINYIKQRTEYTKDLISLKLKRRCQEMERLNTLKNESKSNTEEFVKQVSAQLQILKTEIERSTLLPSKHTSDNFKSTTTTAAAAATQCQSDVKQLLMRIKSMTAEALESERLQ